MTKDVLVSMLRQGNTGNEILQILDVLASDESAANVEPTLEEIQF